MIAANFFVSLSITQIPFLANNTNIILIDDFTCPVEYKCVELKKRTATNLRKSLEKIGYEHEKITNLLKETNGLFVPLYSKICDNSIISFKYKIDENDFTILSSLLFVKSFSEKSFDLVCEAYGFSKNDLISVVSKYTNGENPLLYKNSRGEIKFSAFEYAWNTLSKFICQETINNSFKLFKKLKSSQTNENLNICKNILNWCGYCKFVLLNAELSYLIDDLFKTMFEKVQINEIVNLINDLTDIEPDLVLNLLNDTLCDDNKTAELMDDVYNARCKVLWSLEQCIQIPELTMKALEILCKLNEIDSRENGNSPQATLKDAFCPWFNVFPEEVKDQKLKFAEKLISKYPKFWDILFINFPQKGQVIFGNYYPLAFLGSKINNSVPLETYFRDVEGYLDLCLKKVKNDVDKLIKILDEINHFSEEKINSFIKIISSQIETLDDLEKMKIKEAVREIIYKHRFFADAEWALPENKLIIYLNLLNEIKFSKEEYDYHYLYSNYCELSLLNPVPYETESYHEKNESSMDELRFNKLCEFKNKNLDLGLLMDLSSEQSTILGTYIAKVYCCPKKNEQIIKKVFEASNFNIARRLCLEIVNNNIEELVYLNDLYKTSKNYNEQNHSIVLSCYHELDSSILSLIHSQDKNVQCFYFSNHALFFREKENDPKLVKSVLDSSLEFKKISIFIEYLYEGRLSLSQKEIFDYMKSLTKYLPSRGFGVMDDYYLSEISKMLVDYVGVNREKLSIMSSIEEAFFRRDENRHHFLKNYASIYPDYIIEILLILFGKIKGDKTEAYSKLFYLNFFLDFFL